MKHLEEERDLYKAEYLKLKDLNKNGKRQEVLEQVCVSKSS